MWERRARPVARIAAVLATLALLSAPSSTLVPRRLPGVAASRTLAATTEPARTVGVSDGYGLASSPLVAPAAHETAIVPPPAEFDAPPAPPAAPPAVLHSTAPSPAGGVWAVLIGIDDYPGSRSDLRASVADANELDTALATYGVPADRRLVLRNTQATAATIGDSLRWLVAHASADSTVVFFYAGHVRKLGGGTEAVVAADGNLLTDSSMASLLRPLASNRVWIGMASCYGGGFTELLAPGRILTGAAGANSLAYENSRFGHSYLVEYMVHRAMNQRQAPASVERSFAWAADALRREYPNRVPVQYDQLDGELPLGTPPPTAGSPAPPPPGSGGGPGSPGSPPPSDPGSPAPDDDPCVITIGSLVGCE